ncbi:MAG: 1,4-alpha-glucan branching protein GlgB [Xanthomonadales bacterium]|nr:1,4-alpha-glucan branching protein GlgB [Xanthomonadales bacterium]
MSTKPDHSMLEAMALGNFARPFEVLGVQQSGNSRVVRTFQPDAEKVNLLDRQGKRLGVFTRLHKEGIFEAEMPPRLRIYQLEITARNGDQYRLEDPYRFPSRLGSLDLHLLAEGSHEQLYSVLGAHPATLMGVSGTAFSVWAPNASRASVVGNFNSWDGRRHVMRLHPDNGIWEIFLPGVEAGSCYKFELLDSKGKLLPLKADPYGCYHESPPGNASIVYTSQYQWQDQQWQDQRKGKLGLDEPQSIYEVHLGSWRRNADGSWIGYRDIASQLIDYTIEMGFTHVEFLPITEHPFDGSWGYQPIGMYAPTQRFGDPDDFRYLVDRLHGAGIGVIIDWVPAHFPNDDHGLRLFDGTALYEHSDPRKGAHAEWGTLIFNYGRREVQNYLLGNALYWIREFHIDALRVDAVASMLYLDYARKPGEWLPNEHGGNQNLEAVDFLKKLNRLVHREGASCHAEESTSWPGVSHPADNGGLGFTCKWNMGWMNDTLAYMKEDPLNRQYHHDRMTFGIVYAFSENFILPLSHDEVVHGKGTLLGRMPGDEWQRFANLRAYFGFMFGHPGKKLLFMGNEFAQTREWSHDRQVDWPLLEFKPHAGMQLLIKTLNDVYRQTPALYEQDFSSKGFDWIDCHDQSRSIFSWVRYARDGSFVIVICNFTPVVREAFQVGVPEPGTYRVLVNSDDEEFGGSDAEKITELDTRGAGCHNKPDSLVFTLPPLATMILAPVSKAGQKQEQLN